jgi:SAM-dependent methyltransferase
MPAWLTPRRRRGVEYLDDPAVPDDVRLASMHNVERSNALFGGTRAVLSAFERELPTLPRQATLLDVGCGMGDISAALRRRAHHAGVTLTCIGVDVSEAVLRGEDARDRLDARVVSDALTLPLRDRCADVVVCSQLLHHFEPEAARRLLAELHRIARGAVIVADLRRSWLAAAGFWISALALRWHPVTRHDGVASVLRGFTAADLSALILAATGCRATIQPRLVSRLTATWHR